MTAPYHFLSFSSADRELAGRVEAGLRARGLEIWFDQDRLNTGDEWRTKVLEGIRDAAGVILLVGTGPLGRIQREELIFALDRRSSAPDYRIFVLVVPNSAINDSNEILFDQLRATTSYLSLTTPLDDRQFDQIADALRDVRSGTVASVLGPCPYVGLKPLSQDNAAQFFGRSAELADLVDGLRSAQIFSIIGPSGTGKSSLARAGLARAIADGSLGPPGRWRLEVVQLTGRPLDAVATDLETDNTLAAFGQLSERDDALRLLLAGRVATTPDVDLIIVFDQFEAIYGNGADAAQRDRFVSLFLALFTGPDFRCPDRVHVVVTVRSDFLDRVNAVSGLGAAITLKGRHVVLGPMSHDDLAEVIQQPAHRAGARFAPGLLDVILSDVEHQPNALPLLAYALERMWPNAEGDTFTVGSYQRAGGVAGALDSGADTCIAPFRRDHEAVVRWVLLRLVDFDTGAAVARRRRTRSQLSPAEAAQQPVAADLVDALVRDRFLVGDSDDRSAPQGAYQFAHDSIPNSWKTLRDWIVEARRTEAPRQELSDNAQAWSDSGRARSFLLARRRLAPLVEASRATGGLLDAHEAQYVEASQRWTRLKSIAATLAIAVVAGLVGVASLSTIRSRNDRAQTRGAQALRLAADATRESVVRPDLGLLLALESVARTNDTAARSALVGAMSLRAQPTRFWSSGAPSERALVIAGGSRIVTADGGSTIRVCDVAAEACRPWLAGMPASVVDLASAADGRMVAAVLASGAVYAGDSSSTPTPLSGGFDATAVSVSARGDLIAIGGRDGTVQVRRAASSGAPLTVGSPGPSVAHVALDPQLHWVASSGAQGPIEVYSLGTAAPLRIGFDGAVDALTFTADGSALIATDGDSGDLLIWNVASVADSPGAQPRRLAGHASPPNVVSVVGTVLVSGDRTGEIRRWDLERFAQIGVAFLSRPSTRRLEAAGSSIGVAGVGLRSDGSTIIEVREDGEVIAWEANDHSAIATASLLMTTGVADIAGSVAGSVAALHPDGSVELFDARGRPIATVRSQVLKPTRVEFTPDATKVVVMGESAELVDVRGGQATRLVGPAPFTAVAVSASEVALGDTTGAVQVFAFDGNLRRAVSSFSLQTDAQPFVALSYSPDGSRLAGALAGTRDARIRIATGGTDVRFLVGHTTEVDAFAWSPDGKRLFSASDDRSIRQWDTSSWTTVAVNDEHADRVTAVIAPAGSGLVVSASQDGTTRLWDLTTGASIGDGLRWGTGIVDEVVPVGNATVVSRIGNQLVWWPIGVDVWSKRACTIANRALSTEELARYLGGQPARHRCVPG